MNRQPDGDAIEQLVGTETNLFEQYKSEVGGADSGPFAGDYVTTYENEPTDPQDATIVWLEGDVIDCSEECYLTVKDGNHSPSLYVFDITGWDGMMSIVLTGFWPRGGAISNIAIWSGNDVRVPEPGSLALLGIGLLGFGMSRRRTR
ncbi:MAG: PEP-CTERM sorting domain-containing protein [Gammaproteobacteria bacterium]|nr:PEP-CTERM sorting domain-containing protein [Gammaproteobacteria bacterium]MDH4254904.1 PEP-CTERM sorting domain-containing protein [Gammaproteobacteria bacterium]MDH5309911.1 PEP-CTERM sorting domain-containing protein [Gammaproteobacteria bacterium]